MDTPQSFNKSSRILPWTPEFSHGPVDPTGPSTPTAGGGLTVLNKNNGRRVAGNGENVTVRLWLRRLARAFVRFFFGEERGQGERDGGCVKPEHRNVTTDDLE